MPVGNKRTVNLGTRYTPEEYALVELRFSESGCDTISEYIRKQAMGVPVSLLIANSPLDKCLEELILLRSEMSRLRELGVFTIEQTDRLVGINKEIGLIITNIFYACENHFAHAAQGNHRVSREKD